VLVVDDEPEIAELLAVRLTSSGFEVQTAHSGQRALDILEVNPIDLVFLDISMPGMNGLDTLDRLRDRDGDVGVVLMTGHGSETIVVDALRKGADDYLRKPFSGGEFNAVLERTLAKLDIRRQNSDLRRQLEERVAFMEQQALTDELTGLANRRSFDHHLVRLTQAADRGSQFALLMMDIDHFKQVNDRYGHATGDRLLQEIARLVQSRIRVSDIAARIGGDEFAVLLPRATAADGVRVAEALRIGIAGSAIDTGKGPLHATISIGVADSSAGGSVLEAADSALYGAKSGGRNLVVRDGAEPEVSPRG
jgi:diguanylate cyclase (GGDEF)-like protein